MGLKVEPLTKVLGAEVTGADLRRPLDRQTVDLIVRALAEHLILVFPCQPMDDARQIAFSENFGLLDRDASRRQSRQSRSLGPPTAVYLAEPYGDSKYRCLMQRTTISMGATVS